jgi:UDPglucose 6-dehydrogenase
MTHPDLILIGSRTSSAAEQLARVAHSYTPDHPPIVRLSPIDAELAKISVNTYITTKLSFANQLGEICERLSGADAAAVASAIGLDTRIGGKYLRPATAYGGPCFPRDNRELVLAHLPRGGRVTILGLTYKPDTPVVEEAAGIALARELVERGVLVTVHDPAGMEAARTELGSTVTYADQLGEAVPPADVVAITTPWPAFADVAQTPGARVVVDCWRICTSTSPASSRLIYPGTYNATTGERTAHPSSAGVPA